MESDHELELFEDDDGVPDAEAVRSARRRALLALGMAASLVYWTWYLVAVEEAPAVILLVLLPLLKVFPGALRQLWRPNLSRLTTAPPVDPVKRILAEADAGAPDPTLGLPLSERLLELQSDRDALEPRGSFLRRHGHAVTLWCSALGMVGWLVAMVLGLLSGGPDAWFVGLMGVVMVVVFGGSGVVAHRRELRRRRAVAIAEERLAEALGAAPQGPALEPGAAPEDRP